MNMSNEIWKPIPETKGYYHISNIGRVKSYVKRLRNNKGQFNGIGKRQEGKIIEASTSGFYKIFDVNRKINRKTFYVHRLVAEAFVPNPDNKPCINHINGNKHDNRATNLEWCTHAENMGHAKDTGLMKVGENHGHAKLNRKDVLEIRAAYNLGCFTLRDLYEAYGTSVDNMRHIVQRKSWRHI